MDIRFEKMTGNYGKEVIDIFNYYAEHSFAAYPEAKIPYQFYGKFLEMTKNYPAYVIRDTDQNKVSGFCFLRAYNPFPVFKESAEISYFIDKDYVGQGIGKKALELLTEDARKQGVKTILASITSLNASSIRFHQRNGFKECGRLARVGRKFGEYFDILWMQKDI